MAPPLQNHARMRIGRPPPPPPAEAPPRLDPGLEAQIASLRKAVVAARAAHRAAQESYRTAETELHAVREEALVAVERAEAKRKFAEHALEDRCRSVSYKEGAFEASWVFSERADEARTRLSAAEAKSERAWREAVARRTDYLWLSARLEAMTIHLNRAAREAIQAPFTPVRRSR